MMTTKSIRRSFAHTIARPYVYRELPAWGRVFKLVVGDNRRDWLWRGERASVIDKKTGFDLDLDLGWWSDRMTYFLGRWYDLHSQLIINEFVKLDDVVIDVGANRGMFALYASKQLGPTGRLICFEPNLACVAKLDQTIRANRISNIEVRPVGLSDSAEILNLMVPACDTGLGTFASYGSEMQEVAMKCSVLVGDDALCGVCPNFIKIDVEGFELKVIRGLKKTLQRYRPIIYMELVPAHLERAGSSARELIDLMTGLGYLGRRAVYKSRRPTKCSYADLSEPIVACDVLWTPNL